MLPIPVVDPSENLAGILTGKITERRSRQTFLFDEIKPLVGGNRVQPSVETVVQNGVYLKFT